MRLTARACSSHEEKFLILFGHHQVADQLRILEHFSSKGIVSAENILTLNDLLIGPSFEIIGY